MRERENKTDSEQHRHGQLNVTAPERQYPVVDLQRRRHRDNQRRRRKEEAEVRIHSADVHMVRPDDEAQTTDGDDGPDHHAVAEDVLARVRREDVGHHAEGRQRYDVDLGMAEKPE